MTIAGLLRQAARIIQPHKGHRVVSEDLERAAAEIEENGLIPIGSSVKVGLQRVCEHYGLEVRHVSESRVSEGIVYRVSIEDPEEGSR